MIRGMIGEMENMQIFEIQTQVLKVHENLTFIVSWVIGTSIFISILLCLKKIDGLEKKKGKADTQSYYVILDIVQSVEKISFLCNANGTALESFMGLLQLRFRHGTIL